MSVEELPRYRCDGTRANGRHCGTIFFEGWIDKGYLLILCSRCHKSHVIESWPPESYTTSGAVNLTERVTIEA